jgi:pilus assembly protein CpaC
MQTIRAYLDSVHTAQLRKITERAAIGVLPPRPPQGDGQPAPRPDGQPLPLAPAALEPTSGRTLEATVGRPQVINLIRVPGTQQVLLKVRVAELNRTAFRQIGADFLAGSPSRGYLIGSQIGGSTVSAGVQAGDRALSVPVVAPASRTLQGFAETMLSGATTAFGIFEHGDFAIFLSALRRNSLLRILAEPNLVALNGHAATFLAGGSFPVPVPQSGAGIGAAPTITVQFQPFGVQLAFLPTVLDGDVIRLAVDPEVSTIDFTIGTTLVAGGSVVPGLNIRKAHTVVEMHEGQTLAIAGLLQLTMDGQTQRIPGLGDLPILGPFFSNTTGNRIEKELIVLVTPYLVEPMNHDQVPPTPGDDVKTPTDLEFYLLNRIEGRTVDWRATTQYECQLPLLRCLLRLDDGNVRGPHGFCE